jgi:hypothetical protein
VASITNKFASPLTVVSIACTYRRSRQERAR